MKLSPEGIAKMDEEVERIRSFADLQEDWDSYGGKPISPAAIEAAVTVLRMMAATDDPEDEPLHVSIFPAPTSAGHVLFECENADGWAMLEFNAEGKFEFFIGNREF